MVSNRTVGHFTKVLQGPRAYQEALGVSLANLKRAALAAPPSGPDMLSLEDTEGQLEEEMSCMPDISAPASATQASLGGLGGAPALEHHVDGASSGMLALECGPASTSTSIMPPTPTHASASDCNWQFLDVLRAGFTGSVQQSSYAALASGKQARLPCAAPGTAPGPFESTSVHRFKKLRKTTRPATGCGWTAGSPGAAASGLSHVVQSACICRCRFHENFASSLEGG